MIIFLWGLERRGCMRMVGMGRGAMGRGAMGMEGMVRGG